MQNTHDRNILITIHLHDTIFLILIIDSLDTIDTMLSFNISFPYVNITGDHDKQF